jgi:hypothetical protein
VSAAPPVIAAPLRRSPFLLLPILVLAALWLLDSHQPAAWPDAATPWFAEVRALSPATWALDRLNTHARLAPDVPVGSALVLVATIVCSFATLVAIDVPALLAIAIAIGLAATRTLWSTAAPGHDALPVATVAFAVALLTRRSGPRSSALAALATVTLSPPTAWLVLPASLASGTSARWRLGLAVGVIVAAIAAPVFVLHAAWTQTGCLPPAMWTSAITEVLRPGLSADASPWLAIRQAAAVFAGDVHLFGIGVAAFGLTYQLPCAPRLRAATIAAVAVALVVVGAGLLPPAFTAGLLLPWWAPWFGVGLSALVRLTGHGRPRLALACAIVFAACLPPLRHATVVPGPWRIGMPATTRAVSPTGHGGLVASDDAALTRRLRLVGATTVPADGATLDACVASGRDVFAIGPVVSRVQHLGHRVVEHPLRPSLAALVQDMRADQVVALAIAPGAISWAGPGGFTTLARLGVPRDTSATTAIGIVARTDRGGEVRTGRQGIDLTWREGDDIAGYQLQQPIAVGAHDGDTSVSSPPITLARGRHASIAIFDRGSEPVLRGVGLAEPGLPITLANQWDWRDVLVRGRGRCVAASRAWTTPPASMSRLSVPVIGATPANPALVLLASDAPPQVTIDGLPAGAPADAARITVFDRQSPADASRLRETQRGDGVDGEQMPSGRWIARIELRAHRTSPAPRAAVTPGVVPAGWLVRLASPGSRTANVAVCEIVAGERMLLGQSGVVDDETALETTVAEGYGWHEPERVHGSVFQWSASPTATATFTLERPTPVVLALDATGASPPAGRQALTVRVNDHVVSADWPGADRATIPGEALRAGLNTITLSVSQTVQPGRDARTLGVLVRQLRVIVPQAR